MWGTALNTNIKTLLNAAQFPKDLSLQNFSTQLQFKRLEWYSDKRCEKILDQVNRQDFYCQLSTFKKQTAFSLKKTRNSFLTSFPPYWKRNILISILVSFFSPWDAKTNTETSKMGLSETARLWSVLGLMRSIIDGLSRGSSILSCSRRKSLMSPGPKRQQEWGRGTGHPSLLQLILSLLHLLSKVSIV